MRNILAIVSVVLLTFLLSACGEGGGDVAAAASSGATPVTLYHPNGRIAAQGFYAAGTTTRVGVWSEYFDQGGSPKQWDRGYANGTWNQATAWREFNSDGSTRTDWTDR